MKMFKPSSTMKGTVLQSNGLGFQRVDPRDSNFCFTNMLHRSSKVCMHLVNCAYKSEAAHRTCAPTRYHRYDAIPSIRSSHRKHI